MYPINISMICISKIQALELITSTLSCIYHIIRFITHMRSINIPVKFGTPIGMNGINGEGEGRGTTGCGSKTGDSMGD